MLRETRSELLKPHLFIAELCRRNNKKGLIMKVITIESSAYRAMTEQIAEIADYVRRNMEAGRQEPSDRIIGTDEAARMLGVSRRTLQRMRSEHRIRYVILRGKCGYRLSEINRLLDASTVNGDASTPEELKRNHSLRTGRAKGRRT